MSFVPWLKFGGHEIANYNRTVSYISNGLLRDGRVNAAPGCGCDAIDEGPYDTPATDDAPWYVSARPESGDFLGMILDRIEMNGPWARGVTARGGDGSVIGPQRLRGRVLSFRGILYAGSPQAMDYGKRWLSEALRNCDSLCGLGDLCLLPACPEGEADTDQFFRTLKRAALIDGPTEVEIPGVPCDLITRMDWQMAAEVGYLYADPTTCMEDEVIAAGGVESCLLTTEEWIGDATAKVTVVAGSPNRVEGLRVVATPTKDGICPANPLDDAEAYWTARDYDGGADLDDQSGNGHHAAFGAGAAAPLFLEPTPNDRQFLYLPGISGNDVSTPDDAALDIVGDIDLRAELALDDWTPVANITILSKYGAAPNKSYQLRVLTSGVVRLGWSNDGTADLTADSTVATGLANAERKWIRATLDVDNGAAGRTIRFYTSANGVTWTQLGTDVVQAGVTAISAGTTALSFQSTIVGKVYGAEVRDGIGGTAVANPDFSDRSTVVAPFSTFADPAGRTWTINRAATGLKSAVVDRALFLLGTDDYFEVPDSAGLDFVSANEFTLMLAGRVYGTTITQTYLAKKTGGGSGSAGYSLERGSTANLGIFRAADGATVTTDVPASAMSEGVAFTLGGVRRKIPDQLEAYKDGVPSGTPTADTLGNLSNAEVLRIGRFSGAGTDYADMEFFGAMIWRRELTADEMAIASTSLLGHPPAEASPCSEFTIDGLKPGTQLVVDGAERTVEVQEVNTGRVVGGLEVVTPAEGLFEFIDLGACAFLCVSIDATDATVNSDTRATVEQFNRET